MSSASRMLPFHGRVCFLSLLMLTLSAFSAASAKTLYVNSSSRGAIHDGLSWDTAFATIQAACDVAIAGDEVWVAKGLYNETVSISVPLGLYGGFSGSETSRGQRGWEANATVINGGQSAKVVETYISANKTWSAYYTAVIDGFTVGNTTPGVGTGITAGALNVTISNCDIARFDTGIAVTATGAVSVTCSTIRDNETGVQCGGTSCLFASNLVSGNKGGVDVTTTAALVINNTFINNARGVYGDRTDEQFYNNIFAWNGVAVGAIYSGATPMNNCVWANGVDYAGTDITGTNGNIRADPKMVSAETGEVHLTAQSPCRDTGTSSYTDSTYDLDGQARKQNGYRDIGADEYDGVDRSVTPGIVRVKPDGDDLADGSTWMLAKATLPAAIDALRGRGGEIWLKSGTYEGPTLLTYSVSLLGGFSGTEAERSGRSGTVSILDGAGADSVLSIRCLSGSPLVDGVFLRGGWSGLECSLGTPVVQNSVLAGNVEGGTLSGSSTALKNDTIAENKRGLALTASSPSVTNCVVAANETGVTADATSMPVFAHDCIGANGTDFDGVTDPAGSNGNIHADPVLASPNTGNFHLAAASPCREAGLDSVVDPQSRDLDGEVRVQGAHVDIGADEYNGNPPVIVPLVVRVAPDGDDSRDGSTWDSAKRTIQAGIEAVYSGGEIWVAEGTYAANSRLRPFAHLYGGFTKGIATREGRDPVANPTVLQGDGISPVVSAFGGYTASTADGFTIKGGQAGVLLDNTSAHITGNTITGNTTGVEGIQSSSEIDRNRISRNFEGLQLDGGSPVLRANRISANTDNGILTWNGAPSIRDNSVSGNGRAGLALPDGAATLVNNTFLGNGTAVSYTSATISAANNIVAGNLLAISQIGTTAAVSFKNNCFWDNAQGFSGLTDPTGTSGNITVDPRLCSPAYGDIRLRADSPCRDAGDPSAVLPDDIAFDGSARVYGPQVDIGADESTGGTPVAAPGVIHVSAANGIDSNDGLTWATAKQSVQAGIDAASASGGDVWVASGAYTGGLMLWPFTYLHGGFRGSESTLSERSGNPGNTILDGSGLLNDIKIRGGYTYSGLDGFTVSGARTGVSAMYDAASLTNNLVTANTGSGVYVVSGATNVSGNKVIGNAPGATANGTDYGIKLDSSTALVAGNVVQNNAPNGSTYGGGIGVSGGAPMVVGNLLSGNANGVCISAGAGVVSNNTIVRNKTGISVEALLATPVTIANNVIASNTSRGVYRISGTASPVFRSNNAWSNPTNYSSVTNPTGTNGNISSDPLFRGAAYGNYRLGAGSPCIDTGDDTWVNAGWTDLDGKTRILGSHVDMGAYEYTASAYTLANAIRALNVAAGLSSAIVSDLVQLDVSANSRIDMVDVIRVLRNAVGVDG